MSNKIDERLSEMAAAGRKGLMTHVVVGYPTLEATENLVVMMERVGVDFVELQIPFSDPLADGPTIQRACEAALAGGARVADAFTLARSLSKKVTIPLLFMAYFNTVYKYGVERFCAEAQAAGISGLIVPDAPLEAARHEGFLEACHRYGLHNVVTLAPTSTAKRLEKNAKVASGLVYCMSRQGVTGVQAGFDPELKAYMAQVRSYTQVPLALGFGVSSPERLKAVLPYCDVAVVGSAIVQRIAEADKGRIVEEVEALVTTLAAAM